MDKFKSYEINLITSLLCLMVVFIHISSQAINGLNKASIQFIAIFFIWKLSHFVVQCFILISAVKLCLKYKDKTFDFKTYINFIKGRIVNIYIPYLIANIVFYIYFCSIGYIPFKIEAYFTYILTGDLVAPFYFVVIIMQFYLLMPLWLYIIKKFKPMAVILLSIIIMMTMIYKFPSLLNSLFNINFKYSSRIFTTYLLYWIIGCYIGKFYSEFKSLIVKYKIWIVIFFVMLGILNFVLSYLQSFDIKVFKYLEILHMFYSISAILVVYILCLYLADKKNFFISILDNINNFSMYIYLYHCLILVVLDRIFALGGLNSIGITFTLKILITYPLIYLLTLLYNYITNRI